MKDPRYSELADVLVKYSAAVKPGDRVLIEAFDIPADFTAVPWTAGVHYTPFTLNPLNTISQVNPTPGSYFDLPAFYITDLGTYGTGELYQIDAVGYGGTPNAVSVVESTYVITQSGAQSPNI